MFILTFGLRLTSELWSRNDVLLEIDLVDPICVYQEDRSVDSVKIIICQQNCAPLAVGDMF
jgi:hypothetical protein